MKKTTDNFLTSMMKSVQNRRGASGAFMASDFHKYQWGVKIPHLMMEYVFGLNVFPMPALVELAGLPHSCKSPFLQYIMRIFAENKMYAAMLETEGKMSNTLLSSFLKEYSDGVLVENGPMSQEEWMGEVLTVLKNYRKAYSNSLNGYPKKPILPPFILGLDSLSGGSSQETLDTTDKDKSVGRSFPIEALKNSRFFPQIPTRMRDLPMMFVFTNHEKTRMAEQKGPFMAPGKRSSQGGQRPSFYCGLRIFFEQETKPVTQNGVTSQKVTLEVVKNSFNESRQKISLMMCWKNEIDPETNGVVQTSWFAWNRALAEFLAPSVGETKYNKAEVSKFLKVDRHSETKYSCKQLGLVDVSPEELGDAIEADPELVAKLRPYMGIKTWRVWDGTPLTEEVNGELDMPDPNLELSETEIMHEIERQAEEDGE